MKYNKNKYYSYYNVGDRVKLIKEAQQQTGVTKPVILIDKVWNNKYHEYSYHFVDDETGMTWKIYDSLIDCLVEETMDDYKEEDLPSFSEIV